MSRSNIFVGIRPCKSALEIGLLPEDRSWKSSNDAQALIELLKHLAAVSPALVIVVATAMMEGPLESLLEEAGLPVRVVPPRKVRTYAKAAGALPKCGAIDALVVARYAQSMGFGSCRTKGKQTGELEALLMRRCQLLEMLAVEQDRLRSAVNGVRREIEAHISWLQKCLRKVDKNTGSLVTSMFRVRKRKRAMQIVPGAGPIWAVMDTENGTRG